MKFRFEKVLRNRDENVDPALSQVWNRYEKELKILEHEWYKSDPFQTCPIANPNDINRIDT